MKSRRHTSVDSPGACPPLVARRRGWAVQNGRPVPCCLMRHKARAAALMTALFIMAAVTAVVIAVVDTEMIQYAALNNTLAYERARYLAEAGIAHALAMLESDPAWRGTIPATEYPPGSGFVYDAQATDGTNGKIVVRATGKSGAAVRRLEAVVDLGG